MAHHIIKYELHELRGNCCSSSSTRDNLWCSWNKVFNNKGSYKVLLNERFCIVYVQGLINTEFRINLVSLFTVIDKCISRTYKTNIYISKKKLEAPYVVSLMVNCNIWWRFAASLSITENKFCEASRTRWNSDLIPLCDLLSKLKGMPSHCHHFCFPFVDHSCLDVHKVVFCSAENGRVRIKLKVFTEVRLWGRKVYGLSFKHQ